MKKIPLLISISLLAACGGSEISETTAVPTTTTALATTTTTPTTTTAIPTSNTNPINITGWSCASDRQPTVSYTYQNSVISLNNDESVYPLESFQEVYISTEPNNEGPSGWMGGSETNGFNEHYFTKTPFGSGNISMLNPTPHNVPVRVSLTVVYPSGSSCTSTIFNNFSYETGPSLDDPIDLPSGVNVNNNRYSSFVLPEPTIESVIYSVSQNDPYQETPGWQTETIRDFSTKLRVALYGDPKQHHWQVIADVIEVLQVIAPDLDARFATTHREVTLAIHVIECTDWRRNIEQESCNSFGMGGGYSDGATREWTNLLSSIPSGNLGSLWLDSSAVTEWGDNSITTLRHEFGHVVGLPHVKCSGSMMIVPDNQGMFFTGSDLAGIAVHQDPRTTHNMTADEARLILLPDVSDADWNAVMDNRSLICNNPTASFDQLASDLAANSVRSDN